MAILVLFLAAVAACVAVAASRQVFPRKVEAAPGQPGPPPGADAYFYEAVVQRLRAGEGYYEAVAVELRREGYQPHSVFNWRPPLYAWLFSQLPGLAFARVLLGLLALGVWLLAIGFFHRQGAPKQTILAAVSLVGALAWCAFGNLALFTELWSGLLIALSILALALDRGRLGWVAALLAVGFRELALPYYLLAGARACYKRRDVFLWVGGLAACAIYLALHVQAASRYLDKTDVVHAGGWVQFGGLVFVLLTAQLNVVLILLPSVVTAIYLPLALLGLAGWRGPGGALAALTAFGFVIAFLVVGIWPLNGYWGLMYAPLLSIGAALAPAALRDLWRAVFCSPQ